MTLSTFDNCLHDDPDGDLVEYDENGMIDWRTDMENAPRDGTQVLLYDTGTGPHSAECKKGYWTEIDGREGWWSVTLWPLDNVTHWALINLPEGV